MRDVVWGQLTPNDTPNTLSLFSQLEGFWSSIIQYIVAFLAIIRHRSVLNHKHRRRSISIPPGNARGSSCITTNRPFYGNHSLARHRFQSRWDDSALGYPQRLMFTNHCESIGIRYSAVLHIQTRLPVAAETSGMVNA